MTSCDRVAAVNGIRTNSWSKDGQFEIATTANQKDLRDATLYQHKNKVNAMLDDEVIADPEEALLEVVVSYERNGHQV
jgi:hypothetical protein